MTLCHIKQAVTTAEAGRIQTDVDLLLGGKLNQPRGKFRVGQHFAAADGHTAAGVVVKALVLRHLEDDLLGGHLPGHGLKASGKAEFGAGIAQVALLPVDADIRLCVQIDGLPGTMGQAIPAFDAAVRHLDQLLLIADQLGIVAPAAVQRAALQENCRADAGAIFS